ncbi:MAG: SAM-dependent methyltransferase [Bacteroidetes bacterium]|nr:SAM-dependent methyltransferase [Bacteroidota bacterium]HET6243555.1 SAM-dependent methyltransferase [Bacteroidia bacterium]
MELNNEFWNNRYINKDTGWDLGSVSTPLQYYFDQLSDKNLRILIPGGGNAYEAEYLFNHGFKNIFLLDYSTLALENFQKRVPDFPTNHLICQDFFEHKGRYDLIVEQTFFCAIDPSLRKNYVKKVCELLSSSGKIAGVLFNAVLNQDKPPFGGNKEEYEKLFQNNFEITTLEIAYNSIKPRAGRELFFNFKRKS